jgi:hypothetical protein
MKATSLFGALLLLLSADAARAQWAKQRDPRIPLTRDGQANLAAPAPRASDGKPDLSGVWLTDGGPVPPGVPTVEGDELRVSRQFIDVTGGMKPGQVQMEPWAAELFKKHVASNGTLDPVARCQPAGEPSQPEVPLPYKIVQTPGLIIVLYEENSIHRQIFLDGRKMVPEAEPRWQGYSTGRWEGDTLVVETAGFNDRTWLDRTGHPHSDAMRLTERFRRRDAGHLEVDITITDPKAYRTPITYKRQATLLPDEDLLEYFCTENEKSVQRFRP